MYRCGDGMVGMEAMMYIVDIYSHMYYLSLSVYIYIYMYVFICIYTYIFFYMSVYTHMHFFPNLPGEVC